MEDFLERYSRTIILEGVDFNGQNKISNSKILVIGAGGISSSILSILSASGVGAIYISEPDFLEASNLQRQFIYKNKDIGKSKADLALQFINDLNPSINAKLWKDSLQDIDLIIDGTDSFKSRLKSNTLALKLNVPFFTGSAIGFTGHVYSFFPSIQTGCYACLFGNDEDYSEEKTCANSGIFPPLPSIVGSIIAHNVLFYLSYYKIKREKFFSKFILIDFLKEKFFKELTFERDKKCTICKK